MNDFLARTQDKLTALEGIRLTKARIYARRKKISLPLAVFIAPGLAYLDYWLLMFQRSNDDSFAGLTLLFLGGLYAWMTQPKRDYAKAYKIRILPEIIKLFGPFTYDPNGKIDKTRLNASKIMPRYDADSYESEDYFSGTHKGARIEFSEIKLSYTTGHGKNRRTVTSFRGLAVLIGMKGKKFQGHTIVCDNKNKLGRWMEEKRLNLKPANMVDPAFEKIFDAYTNDQVEARYLLDPVIIERVVKIHEQFAAEPPRIRDEAERWFKRRIHSQMRKNMPLLSLSRPPATAEPCELSLAFYDHQVLLLIPSNHNHFEPADLHVPAANPEGLIRMKTEIETVLALVEHLELHDKSPAQPGQNPAEIKSAQGQKGIG